MSYQVFIDGVKPTSQVDRCAEAISQKYGLPASALAQRLAKGRFRVKNGVDLDTAKRFAQDLDTMGAVASVVGADGSVAFTTKQDPAAQEELLDLMAAPEPVAPAMSAQLPAQPAPPPAAASDSPFGGIAVDSAPAPEPSPLAGITAERPAVQESTGLDAAMSGGAKQDLGALGSGDSHLSLSAVDGSEEPKQEKAAKAASFAPPTSEAAFLPPDAQEEREIEVEMGDLPERPPPSRQLPAELPPPEELAGGADASLGEARVPGESVTTRIWNRLNDDDRMRFAAGVLLVTLLAFVPVHLYATMSENSAYSKMRADVLETQALVEDPDEWDNLADFRKGVADRMDSKRQNIAITGGLLWMGMAGGLGFVFFRKLPWDVNGPRIAKAPERAPTAEP